MKRRHPRPNVRAKRKIFILDDHPMTRHGLAQLINCEKDLVVCGEASNAEQAFAALRPPLPDLIVADITMSGKSGLDFISDMQSLHPEVAILVLSMHHENIYAERVLRSGGRGYIMKTEGGERLLLAIRRVLGGDIYISDGMSSAIINVFASRESRTGLALLTAREFEVFQLLGSGLSSRQISQRLCISIPTVGTHRMQIKKKLCLQPGAELVQYAVRWAATQSLI